MSDRFHQMTAFKGFPRESVAFLAALAKNNDKYWFAEHKGEYEEHVLQPAQALVAAMGERLKTLRPRVIADPRVNKSIFRVHRDTRFSGDKRPYKTHLGVFFWEGAGKKMESSGFYFHVEPGYFMVAAGIYFFPPRLLSLYRENVAHERHGAALARIVKQVQKDGKVLVGGEHYRRVPRGYDPEHPRGELLRYHALYAFVESKVPKELFSGALIAHCLQLWTPMVPLHDWLVEMTARE